MDYIEDWPVVGFFVPEYRYGDPTRAMVWLERLRVAGIAATYVVIVMYGTFGLGDVVPLLQGHMIDTAIGTPAMLLGMILLLAVAEPGERVDLLSSLGAPLGRIAAVVGGYAAVACIGSQVTNHIYPAGHGFFVEIALRLFMLVFVLFMFVVVFPAGLIIGYLAVRHWCVAADGHPMLPAVITMFYAAIQLGLFVVEGGLSILPTGLRVTIGVGGPLCLAAIAAVELWLHHEEGVSIRSLP